MGDGCGVRKFWVVGGIGIGLAMCFVALLVVGTYMAAAGLGGAGEQRAPSAWPRARCRPRTSRSCRSGAISARRINPGAAGRAALPGERLEPEGAEPGRGAGHRAVHPRHLGRARRRRGRGRRTGTCGTRRTRSRRPPPTTASSPAYVKDVPGDSTRQHARRVQRGRVRGDQVRRRAAVPRDAELREDHHDPGEELRRARRARSQPSQQAAGAIYFAQKKLGTPYLWGGNGTADAGRAVRLLRADAGRVPDRRHRAAARGERPVQRRAAPEAGRAAPR